MLEIGRGGGSLDMWRQYLALATVYGADEANVTAVANDLSARGVALDFVIDDGSHRFHEQLVHLGSLFRLVRPGGWCKPSQCNSRRRAQPRLLTLTPSPSHPARPHSHAHRPAPSHGCRGIDSLHA